MKHKCKNYKVNLWDFVEESSSREQVKNNQAKCQVMAFRRLAKVGNNYETRSFENNNTFTFNERE